MGAGRLDSVDLGERLAQRLGVLDRRAPQQRAVDVPQQQEREPAQRLKSVDESSRRAKAAIRRAAAWTSDIWTISTGECM